MRVSGPQSANSSTFSRHMILGCALAAHLSTIHARPRTFFSTGFPPLALLWWRQSGLNHARPTGRPCVAVAGSTSHTDSQ